MKYFFGIIGGIIGLVSFCTLAFNLIATTAYPGVIGVWFVKNITPENAIYLGIIAAVFLFVWYVLETLNEEKKSKKNERFYTSYGSFK